MDESFGRSSGRITIECIMQKQSGKVSVSSAWLRKDSVVSCCEQGTEHSFSTSGPSGFSRTVIHGSKLN
jgi:hypothetical protein